MKQHLPSPLLCCVLCAVLCLDILPSSEFGRKSSFFLKISEGQTACVQLDRGFQTQVSWPPKLMFPLHTLHSWTHSGLCQASSWRHGDELIETSSSSMRWVSVGKGCG